MNNDISAAENRRLRQELQTLQSQQRAALRTLAVLTDWILRERELTIDQATQLLAYAESLRLILTGEALPC